MDTTFHNVTITIQATSSRKAYDELCDALHTVGADRIEWTTDTYSTETEQAERPTSDLFPNADPQPVPVRTVTREQLIEALIDWRTEEMDNDDIREWLREGRIGYDQMKDEELIELYVNAFDVDARISGTTKEAL